MEYSYTENEFEARVKQHLLPLSERLGYHLSALDILEKEEYFLTFSDLPDEEKLRQLDFLLEHGNLYTLNDKTLFDALKSIYGTPENEFPFLGWQSMSREQTENIIKAFANYFHFDIPKDIFSEESFEGYLMNSSPTFSSSSLYRIFSYCLCLDIDVRPLFGEKFSHTALDESYYFFNHQLFSPIAYSIEDCKSEKILKMLEEFLKNI